MIVDPLLKLFFIFGKQIKSLIYILQSESIVSFKKCTAHFVCFLLGPRKYDSSKYKHLENLLRVVFKVSTLRYFSPENIKFKFLVYVFENTIAYVFTVICIGIHLSIHVNSDGFHVIGSVLCFDSFKDLHDFCASLCFSSSLILYIIFIIRPHIVGKITDGKDGTVSALVDGFVPIVLNDRKVRAFRFFEFTQIDGHNGVPPYLLYHNPLECARHKIKIFDIICYYSAINKEEC